MIFVVKDKLATTFDLTDYDFSEECDYYLIGNHDVGSSNAYVSIYNEIDYDNFLDLIKASLSSIRGVIVANADGLRQYSLREVEIYLQKRFFAGKKMFTLSPAVRNRLSFKKLHNTIKIEEIVDNLDIF